MWYPRSANRPVQISFSLDVALGKRLHETELVPHVDNLATAFPAVAGPAGSAVLPEGAVSVVFKGEELLDQDHWVRLFGLTSWVGLICEGESTHVIRLDGIRQKLHLTRADGELDFEVRSGADVMKRVQLPLEPFIREWLLMQWRERRVRAAFGDESAQISVSERPVCEYCDRLTEIAGTDRLEYTVSHPLAELLLSPIPS